MTIPRVQTYEHTEIAGDNKSSCFVGRGNSVKVSGHIELPIRLAISIDAPDGPFADSLELCDANNIIVRGTERNDQHQFTPRG